MRNPTPKTGLIQTIKRYRRPASRALTAAAFALLCISAYLFKAAPKPALLDEAFYFMVAGSLTFWLTLLLYRSGKKRQISTHEPYATIEDTKPSSESQKPVPSDAGEVYSRPNLPLILLGIAAFLILIEINGGIFHIVALQNATSHVQFILFVTGLVSITLAYAGIRFRLSPFSRLPKPDANAKELSNSLSPSLTGNRQLETNNFSSPQHSVPSTQHFFSLIPHHSLLITIILLAFALRAIGVGSAVHHLVDEIHFSNAILSLRSPDNTVKLLWPINTITAFPWLFSYMQAWGVDLLGRNLDGLRAISVVVGTLGIPALYLLARELFDRKTALLAALFLAVFPPHIQFSRIGLNNIVDPLFGTLALAFLVRGLKYNRPLDFALSGAALGLTQYFYEGGRLLFPALLFLSLAWFTLVKPRFFTEPVSSNPSPPLTGNPELETENLSSPSQHLSSLSPQSSRLSPSVLLTFLLPAILIALPVYSTLIAIRQPFDARFQTVGVGGSYWVRVEQFGKPQTLEEHLLIPFLVYVFQPEIALYYGGEQAMLLPYVVPFVMIGVLALLAYWRTPGVIIVGWVVLASMGNMLLTESAIYARYVVVFPALALLGAVGIRSLTALLWPKRSGWRTGIVILVTAVLCIGQITYFFGPHLARYNDQLRQNFDSEDAIFRSAGFPWGTQIHIIEATTPGQLYLSGLANYLADGLTVFVMPPGDLTAAYANALSRGVDHAFFVEPYDENSVNLLAHYFTLEGPFESPYNVPSNRQLRLYYARATLPAR